MTNLGREGENVEFKESTAEFDKACKAIVAMLNKSGFGTVYFGVKDNGDVIGHAIGKDTLSTLTDRIKAAIKPDVYPTITSFNIDGMNVISVSFSGTNKPYAYKGSFYVRVEQQNLMIDPLVLREMIKNSQEYNERWENEITTHGTEDADEKSLDMFYRQAVALKRINEFKHTSEELLTQLGLMVGGKLTNAGYYLFGKNCNLVYKAVVYPTTDRLNPIDLKRFEGNIFQLINDAIDFINMKMSWRVEIHGIHRTEIPEVPVVALREVVINSLVHCDYYADSQNQVTFDPETIEIYSPGSFGELTPVDYVTKSLPSRTRHRTIQSVIYKAFDIETLGRGLKRMDDACKECGVRWSYQKYDFGFFISFSRKRDNGFLEKEATLSEDAKKIYLYMKENDEKLENGKTAAKAIGKKDRSARNAIKELLENELIVRVGSDRSGYWKIKD